MATPWRLPEVNGDDGAWGDILNQYLNKQHYNNDNSGAGDTASGGHMNITVRAGTTSAGTAPIKFTSGSLMTAPEAGAIEFLTNTLYFTQTTSTYRRVITTGDTHINVGTVDPSTDAGTYGPMTTGDLWIDTN